MANEETSKHLVWWLDELALEGAIHQQRVELPEYIRSELDSANGRVGRGRLWVSQELGDEAPRGADWDERKRSACYAARSAGIVINRVDARIAYETGEGLLTELNMDDYHPTSR